MSIFVYKYNENVCVGSTAPGVDAEVHIPRAVPKGIPYLVILEEDIPENTPPDVWDIDFSNPSGYGTQEMEGNQ